MEKYIQEHTVRSYECDKDASLRLLTLFNLFQETATMQADELNIGYQNLKPLNLTWVGLSYGLKIHKNPKWKDQLLIKTWPSGITAATATRDFIVLDKKTKEIYFTATSLWGMFNLATKKIEPLKKYTPTLNPLMERSFNYNFEKIIPLTNKDFKKYFFVRYDDIDINQHVNNSIYPVWSSESVPNEFRENHSISELFIHFKHPALFGDKIKVLTQINDKKTTHSLLSSNEEQEYARSLIFWKKK